MSDKRTLPRCRRWRRVLLSEQSRRLGVCFACRERQPPPKKAA